MQEQDKIMIGFWPTFAVVLAGLVTVGMVDSNPWGVLWVVKASGLVLGLAGLAGYYLWRSRTSYTRLVRTGLEWVYGMSLLALFGSWILSPDPRQGLARIGWLLGYVLLFYILADAFEAGAERKAVIAALLTAGGIAMLYAVVEILAAYSQWFVAIDSWRLPPSPYQFESILGSSKALAGFANLCGPLAAAAFWRVRKNWLRGLLGFWLLLYLVILPLSFSGGGWFGAAAWLGLAIFFLLKKKRFSVLWPKLMVRTRIILCLAGMVMLVAGLLTTVLFVRALDLSNSLERMNHIWLDTIQVWSSSPWFGSGPGRFSFAYLSAAKNIPPEAWVTQAKNLPAQLVAEFGLIGGLSLVGLVAGNLKWFRERWRLVAEEEKIWGFAILAGCAAWAAQALIDDLSGSAMVMTAWVVMMALFVNLPEKPLDRWEQVSNPILLIPGLMLAIGAGWGLWAYAPLSQGVLAARLGDLSSAAPLFALSAHRDPNSSFYAAQSGFAYARASVSGGREGGLVLAHQAFEKSLEIEPAVSLIRANMAVVDWQSKDYQDRAIANMQKAIALSPNEPSYHLNLGWFFEKRELVIQAAGAYCRVLELEPDWALHPFWQTTKLRQKALEDCSATGQPRVEEDYYWENAREAIGNNQLNEAEIYLAYSAWLGEPALAIEVSRGMLAERRGDRAGAIAAYESVAEIVERPLLNTPQAFMLVYTEKVNHRQGITDDLVPGYLQLGRDYGQFLALEKLYATYQNMGECERAARAWQIWQQAVHGGAKEMTPLLFECVQGEGEIGQSATGN